MATHGTTVNEVPTGVKPAVRTTAGLPIYTGVGSINQGDLEAVNKPVVCYSLAEFVETFGEIPSGKWSEWTLHEAAKAHFSAYGVAPVVFINVINPDDTDHVSTATSQTHLVGSDGTVTLQTYGGADEAVYGILPSTVQVRKGGVLKTLGTDYTLAFDEGALVLSVKSGGTIAAGDTLAITFDYLDPSGVVAADIIGGYSGGVYTGIEVVEQVFPALRLVPGLLLAPTWSQTPSVAAALQTKAASINGQFKAVAVIDLSTDSGDIASYSAAAAWKSNNGFDELHAIVGWPKFKNGTDVYNASTIIACVANKTDSDKGGVPYASPSNKSVVGTAAVLDDGTEVLLTKVQANALNAQGIVTFLNGSAGWKLWGNRTAAYPGTTDTKDAFIPVRRMFSWIANTIILTTDRDVDEPGNRRLIDGVLGTIGSFLNGLVAQGALVAGVIEFRTDDNPTVDLADGIIRFHVTLTPPSPAEALEFTLEYDPTALEALF